MMYKSLEKNIHNPHLFNQTQKEERKWNIDKKCLFIVRNEQNFLWNILFSLKMERKRIFVYLVWKE